MSKAALAGGGVSDVYGVGQFLPGGNTGDKAKAFVYVLIAIVVIVLVVVIVKKVFGGIDGLLQKLGLEDTPEQAAAKQKILDATKAASSSASPWSPAFYQAAPSGTNFFHAADAQVLAKQIWNSVGILYDDPESGLAAIKQCPSQANVSWVAQQFQVLYTRDLYDWIRLKYDTGNQKLVFGEIIDYVNNLKKY